MPWTVELNTELDVIEEVFSGYVTKSEVEAATSKAFELAPKDRPSRFLTELRDLDLEHSVVDLYHLPKVWERMQFVRWNRLALLVPSTSAIMKDLQFFETTCLNQGWQVKIFTHRQEAIAWLLR